MCLKNISELKKASVYAFVFALTLSIVASMSLPSNGCAFDEFYSDTLETCVPCEDICYEGSWKDCERHCRAYFYTLTKCSFDQFWSETLEICLNCSLVCEPITSRDCRPRCKRFIEHTTKTLTSSTFSPISSSETPEIKTVKNYNYGSIKLILLITIPSFVVLIFIAAMVFLAVTRYKNREAKRPIQETQQETQPLREGPIALNAARHEDIESGGLPLTEQNSSADE